LFPAGVKLVSEVGWDLVAYFCMTPDTIVKHLNLFKDHLLGLLTGGEAVLMQAFQFEAAKPKGIQFYPKPRSSKSSWTWTIRPSKPFLNVAGSKLLRRASALFQLKLCAPLSVAADSRLISWGCGGNSQGR
jgi:hypothetical protein